MKIPSRNKLKDDLTKALQLEFTNSAQHREILLQVLAVYDELTEVRKEKTRRQGHHNHNMMPFRLLKGDITWDQASDIIQGVVVRHMERPAGVRDRKVNVWDNTTSTDDGKFYYVSIPASLLPQLSKLISRLRDWGLNPSEVDVWWDNHRRYVRTHLMWNVEDFATRCDKCGDPLYVDGKPLAKDDEDDT